MHPLFLLAFVTLAAVAAFGFWTYRSTQRHQETGGRAAGMGGSSDPLSGANDKIRSPEALRGALDAQAADKKYEN